SDRVRQLRDRTHQQPKIGTDRQPTYALLDPVEEVVRLAPGPQADGNTGLSRLGEDRVDGAEHVGMARFPRVAYRTGEIIVESVNLAYHGLRGQDATFHVAVEMDLDRLLAPLEVSPQDLSRVVLNLMNNALYAANHKRRSAGPQFQPRVVVR